MTRGVRLTTVLLLLLSVPHLSFAQERGSEQAEFDARIQKALQYARDNRPDLAIPQFQAAVEVDPENVEAHANLGVLLYFSGKVVESIPHLRLAVTRQPALYRIQGILGLAEVGSQDLLQGRRDLEAAFPLIDDVKFKVQIGLELIGIYTESGDLDQASRILSELRKVAPGNAEVLYAAYRTYSDLSSEAMLALSMMAPESAQMHQVLAHEELKQGNTNGAVTQYRKAIATDPHLPGIHFELAEALHTSADPEARKNAEREYHTAIAEDPMDGKAYSRLGEMDRINGNIPQAREELSKAIQLQPFNANAKANLAKILMDADETEKAFAMLKDSLRLEPTNAQGHYWLATLYRKLGRLNEAKNEIGLFMKYKQMNQQLRAVYRELLVVPQEIGPEEVEK